MLRTPEHAARMMTFIASLLFVALAEMGDKTQLLAMAFATRFPARTALGAVFAATLLNHAVAVTAASAGGAWSRSGGRHHPVAEIVPNTQPTETIRRDPVRSAAPPLSGSL